MIPRPLKWLAGAAAAALCVTAAFGGYEVWHDLQGRPAEDSARPVTPALSLGVLGDSDSQSFHSDYNFPKRFGRWRDVTFQWTEVLHKLRGNELDLGPWGLRGTRRSVAYLADLVGLPGRSPIKEDYLYNMANGGAGCEDLMGYDGRQARRLRAQMDREPERWKQGVVIVRIGVNNLGSNEVLDTLARNPDDPGVRQTIDRCVNTVGAATQLILEGHPGVRIVLVGVLNNADDPSSFGRWETATEYANLSRGLRHYDEGLQRLAAADTRMAFFDDAAWFAAHWGTRDADGKTGSYKTVFVGPDRLPVRLTYGDAPTNAVTGDAHAGVVWTTLWAQTMVGFLNDRFKLGLTPISDDEVWGFLKPAFAVQP